MTKPATIRASDIATTLGKKLFGEDVAIEKPSVLAGDARSSLLFARSFSDDTCNLLNKTVSSVVIAHPSYAGRLKISHILSENPRLDYAISAQKFFATSRPQGIRPTAQIAPHAKLGKNIFIGDYCVIGDDVSIGDNTYIAPHVVISGRVKIGHQCIIQSGTVIGQCALGFEYNEEGILIEVPQLGGVQIGDSVYIGSLCTVCAGAIADTVVSDHTKIDDHVHVAHNCSIGKACMITAGTTLSGSVEVGDQVWIGPNSSIKNSIKIGPRALIGVGSVVVKNVEGGKIVAGNPARVLRDRKGLTES